MRPFDSQLAVRVAAAFGVALFGAAVGGIVVGATVASVTVPDDPGDLSAIGGAMAAGAAGLLAALVVYVVATAIGVRRMVPEGRRAATVTALLVAPIPLAVTAGLASSLEWSAFTVAGALGLLVAVALAVLALAGALDGVRAAQVGSAAAGVAVVGLALSFVLREPVAGAGADLGDLYRRGAIPVALVDGTTLDAPAPGWRVASVEHPVDLSKTPGPLALASAPPRVNWQVRSQVVQLQFVPQPPAGSAACREADTQGACERLGVTPRGAPIWGRRLPVGSGPGYRDVWAVADGGLWLLSVAGPAQAIDVAEAKQVLSRLQPVDVDRYLAVAGTFTAI
jgi:hypothetical protein